MEVILDSTDLKQDSKTNQEIWSAGDHGPRPVAAPQVGGAAEQDRQVGEEAEHERGDVAGAEDNQREEPWRRLLPEEKGVGGAAHLRCSVLNLG